MRYAVILLVVGVSLLVSGCAATPSTGGAAAHPGDEATLLEAHYRAALSALARGDATRAERELKLSLQDNPIHAESHFLLATLLGRRGELDQAIMGYQRTISLEPNNAIARFNLGTAMMWRGEPLLAARQLEEAIAIRPDYVPSYNNLAKAYFLISLPELAIATYEEALRLDPSNAIARENLDVLMGAVGDEVPAGEGERGRPDADAAVPAAPEAPVIAQEARPAEPAHIADLRELLRDLPHVTVEERGGRIVLGGWTAVPGERALLDKIIAGRTDVLDLTGDDAGDPNRLLEIDAIIFFVTGLKTDSVGFNFLRNVSIVAAYFDGDLAPVTDWLFSAAIDYEVNIANAADQRIAFLARPHLTTLSGTPATFIAGGDIVFRVSGTTSGDIKPYPFGTLLDVTPTLLRTVDQDGRPLVHLHVRAGRKSVLPLETLEALVSDDAVAFSNLEVTSEAVLGIGQTLILTGLSQQERQTVRSGVPILMDIPLIKYLFSTESSITSDTSVIILLTPRDPAYWDEQNRRDLEAFVQKRRAFVEAIQGTEEDLRRFRERYPDWHEIAPNRFASHFFLMNVSEAYRAISGMDISDEALDLDIVDKVTGR